VIKNESFKEWLQHQIQSALSKPVEPAPFIIWCDPAQAAFKALAEG
jgi:hypothetical protein